MKALLLPDYQGNVKRWGDYVANLTWQHGSLDESSYRAALRGASLGIAPSLVGRVISRMVAEAGDVANQVKIRSQVQRAYAFVTGRQCQTPETHRLPQPWRQQACFQPAILEKVATKLNVENIERFVASRSPWCPDYISSTDFLTALYRPSERVLIFDAFESQGQRQLE